jgi:predicted dehydrogenase
MLGVALIGAGNVGRIRARVIQASAHSRIRTVADIDAAQAYNLASSIAADATTDWRAAVQSSDIDLVVVSTPTKFHTEPTILALQAGKHVLCEKPLARSAAESGEACEIAERRRLVLKTGFNYRYMKHVRKSKELIDAGLIGPLYFLRCRFGHGGRPGYEQHWCTDRDLSGGGVLLEQGIHILDLVRHFLGDPVEVLAQTSRYFWNFSEVEDNCFLLLKTAEGATAQIHVSWTQWVNIFSLELSGRNGYLHLSGRDGHYGPQKLIWGKRQANHSRPEEQVFEFSSPDDSWVCEWEDFVDAVQTGRRPMSGARDSMRTLELVEAAYQSSKQQAWVDVRKT